jgi:hypothetical protein
MGALSVSAVLAAGVAGAVVTPLWYIAFKDVHARLIPAGSGQIVDFKSAPVSSKVIDLLRGFVVAYVLAYLISGGAAVGRLPSRAVDRTGHLGRAALEACVPARR